MALGPSSCNMPVFYSFYSASSLSRSRPQCVLYGERWLDTSSAVFHKVSPTNLQHQSILQTGKKRHIVPWLTTPSAAPLDASVGYSLVASIPCSSAIFTSSACTFRLSLRLTSSTELLWPTLHQSAAGYSVWIAILVANYMEPYSTV